MDIFTSAGKTLERWRTKGYTLGASYSHRDGRVYGLYDPNQAGTSRGNPAGMVSGAAAIATHPLVRRLFDKSAPGAAMPGSLDYAERCLVMIGFSDPTRDGGQSIIVVGLQNGVVRLDRVVPAEELAEVRQAFMNNFCRGEPPYTLGSGIDASVQAAFGFDQLNAKRNGGQQVKLTSLRSYRGATIGAAVAALLLLTAVPVYVWMQYQENQEVARQQLKKMQGSPAAVYEAEIAKWLTREVHFVGPSIAAVRDALRDMPVQHQGWTFATATCSVDACTIQWDRKEGNLEGFKANAPASWQGIAALGQDSLVMTYPIKWPSGKLDQDKWPSQESAQNDLFTRWQSLAAVGWKASLSGPVQQAIPPGFSQEATKEITGIKGAPRGMPLSVSAQAWWFANPDPDSPVSDSNLGEQVELKSPITVKWDGSTINFTFEGIIYVKN